MAGLGHLHPQFTACPLVHVVGDGDGGGHLEKVWHDSSVQAFHSFCSQNVPEIVDMRLVIRNFGAGERKYCDINVLCCVPDGL